MGYQYRDYDEKRLQRKLIPLNIFVAILCLVAAVSLMVTPFIQIDIAEVMTAVAEMEQDGSSNSDSSTEVSGSGDEKVDAMLESVDGKIGLTPLMFAKVTLAEDGKKGEVFLSSILFDNGLFGKMMTSVANTMAVEAMIDISGKDIDYKTLENGLKKVDGAKSKTEFNKALDDYIKSIETETGEKIDAEAKADILSTAGDMYDDTVAAVGESKFSLEAMVCVYASGDNEQKITNYEDLFFALADGTASLPGSEEGGSNQVADAIKKINDTVNENISYFSYMFYAFCAFAGVWVILFLFAFFHMFAKNKRFTMWYVKLLGGLPCLAFGVSIKVLGIPAVANALFQGEAATFTAILGAISTMTWISGGCYLLLWLVSIFWAFPIKRKIRKLR